MSANGKMKIGVYWAASCGGCDISLLEIGSRILDLVCIADVAFWPCIADFKYTTVAGYPDGYLDVSFFNGAVRNSEQEEIARLLRQKSKTLVAYGACAADGGIPALANLYPLSAIFDAVYRDNPSTHNPGLVEPQHDVTTAVGKLELPRLYSAVLRLGDVVDVDYVIPGCPPQADRVWETIEALASGTVPPRGDEVRVACGDRTVCHECPRRKDTVKIKQFRRHHQFRPDPGLCLLEQGVLCMGPATRSGCGALCLKADMRCEGCYGPPAGVEDQGTAMIGAFGALLDATTEEAAKPLLDQVADPTGTFYRFSLASSTLKVHR